MEVFSFSEKGRRENNEDYILHNQLSPDCAIFLVADGMGGYHHGEIASSLACETIAKHSIENYGKTEVKQLISQALTLANNKINEMRNVLQEKLGTTIAGAVIEGKKAYLFWLGDVRIYQFRKNEIIFQSEDHSFVNELKKQGNVSAKEIERYGNIVTKSLIGISTEEEQPIIKTSLLPGDTLILCTDGFWQKVSVPVIKNLSNEEIFTCINNIGDELDDNYSFLKIKF